jgi:hypothetical protein
VTKDYFEKSLLQLTGEAIQVFMNVLKLSMKEKARKVIDVRSGCCQAISDTRF